MTSKLLYLLRHGEPEKQYQGSYLGRLDAPLSAAGREQASAARLLVSEIKPHACLASPLRRALETAEIATADSGLRVETTDLLKEISFGELEGRTFAEVAAAHPEYPDSWSHLASDFSFPGGEDFAKFSARVEELAGLIRERPEKSLLLVAHGGILRGLLCRFLKIDAREQLRFRFAYTGLAALELYDDDTAVLTGFNTASIA